MSIRYCSFRIGELYEAIGSGDPILLTKTQPLLSRDPELYTVIRAIVQDGLLYHQAFSDDLYNEGIRKIVQLLPASAPPDLDAKDYQVDYHDAWRALPERSLLRHYFNYLTHGRYLFDHPIRPTTLLRYGFLLQEELPQFLQLAEQERLSGSLPWYFVQNTIRLIQHTCESGDDLFVSIAIRGRRYRLLRSKRNGES
ncbi:hypothetical protein [Tumebacillus lipolyticus]|uniref:Uncharacterized protein n=1 Tax=Tumebacillus lipolyticus TaxID=1280370 RepID=A0ABW4ZUA6_9BACL